MKPSESHKPLDEFPGVQENQFPFLCGKRDVVSMVQQPCTQLGVSLDARPRAIVDFRLTHSLSPWGL